ncbi:hypothetical protein SAMN06265360_12012 [Haloechinothrix alba]|uniref:Uncharacterized protein n=1 Tax=Haloechinothrix alba TaxID=664784 RepID=A0A238ZA79_9PSEU|nr:hypothetical protein [Haloechinothrix alba]SNR79888.1 hypothetical protein SAMN06265360_12012 [Haloechinothrix alba]
MSLTITPPLGLDAHRVWVLIASPTGAVDAARVAYHPERARFIALPCLAFDTTAVLPTYPTTGELIPGFRWATTGDVDAHAELFTTSSVEGAW